MTENNRLKFTKRALDALPAKAPGAPHSYHYDTDCRGLALSVGATGRKSFVFYRKVAGVPRRRTLAPYPDMSIEEARRRASLLNGQIAQGIDPFSDKATSKRQARQLSVVNAMTDRGIATMGAGMTLRQAFKVYYEEYSSTHKVTHLEDVAHFRRHIDTSLYGENIADKLLTEVTSGDIRRLHLAMGELKIKTTANRIVSLISAIINRCRSWGYFNGANPCSGLRKFPERARDRFVQPHEMSRFLKAVDAEAKETARDFVLLALLTGARKSNVLAMQWKDVDLDQRTWRIGRTKNGTSQLVHLAVPAHEILMRRLQELRAKGLQQEFVLPGRGETGHLVEPKKAWERILLRATALGIVETLRAESSQPADLARAEFMWLRQPAGLIEEYAQRKDGNLPRVDMRTLHMHDLRRTMGSWAASMGTSLPVIGKVLNHKTLAATQVYARVWADAAREAVESTGAAFFSHKAKA
jgi:integrase